MTVLRIETRIAAPVERCFDLSRSIDLHERSTAKTQERAVAGVTAGLIGDGEEVTWRARHFGVWQLFTSRITEYDRPRHFRDEMQRGAFAHFRHDHDFIERAGGTDMTDTLDFAAPLGVLGRLAEWALLARYLADFLAERNALIKRVAESEEWRSLLPSA